jgi:hypothetical protein
MPEIEDEGFRVIVVCFWVVQSMHFEYPSALLRLNISEAQTIWQCFLVSKC